MERTRPGTTIGRFGRRTTVLVGVIALLAACSAPGGGATAGPPTIPPATIPPASPAGTTTAASLTLELAEDATLGSHVVGADGKSLYVFTVDSGGGSACTGECTSSWPPLTVESVADVAAGAGVTGEVGTITRDDGTTQITLGGRPLYYFAGDEAAGDIGGQGINNVWFLASPDGAPVADAVEPPKGSACTGRYCY